jgi:glucosyl-3-phosphoglycerate synthase
MSTRNRIYQPFTDTVIPVLSGCKIPSALSLAHLLGGHVHLVGLVVLPEDQTLTAGTVAARAMRRELSTLRRKLKLPGQNRVLVSYNPWQELLNLVSTNLPDLLILEWEGMLERLQVTTDDAMSALPCNTALVRGSLPSAPPNIFIPLRGGPHAELALRLGLTLPHSNLRTRHYTSPTSTGVDTPFRGLARILPNLPEVNYGNVVTDNPLQSIRKEAALCNLMIMGYSAQPFKNASVAPSMVHQMIQENTCMMVAVKSRHRGPVQYTGVDAERAGAGAISILVDKWFAENTYHASEFDNIKELVALKRAQNLTISLALPALNEEGTVGEVIRSVKTALMDEHPLLDEIVLIDSNSTDRTREIGADLGVPVYIHQELLPEYGARRGKGEALWKSLLVTHGDIVVWIDTDIINIHPRFVYGVIGPMLVNPRLQFVKGFYQRPLKSGELTQSTGGGRVTELTARPLINLFYPELSGVIQPLSGEYGGRRSALEQLTFFSGYGVETGLLIDAFEKFGLNSIAQVDLLERIHHNQSLEALSKMSFTILQTVLAKLEKRFNLPILEEVNRSMKLIHYEEGVYTLDVQELVEQSRPPMIELPEYQSRIKPPESAS